MSKTYTHHKRNSSECFKLESSHKGNNGLHVRKSKGAEKNKPSSQTLCLVEKSGRRVAGKHTIV